MKTQFILFLLAFTILSNSSIAGEGSIQLKPGPGREKVTGNCIMCHSLDYIEMHSGILTSEQWKNVVKKMIEAYGAPISSDDAPLIIDYLSKYYGKKDSKT